MTDDAIDTRAVEPAPSTEVAEVRATPHPMVAAEVSPAEVDPWRRRSTSRAIGAAGLLLVALALATTWGRTTSGADDGTPAWADTTTWRDDFDRPDGPLEAGLVGTAWSTSGDPRLVDGMLTAERPSTATVNLSVTDAIVRTTVGRAGDGGGPLVRFVDDRNHWALRSAATYGAWNLVLVVDGVDQRTIGLALTETAPTTVVTIATSPDRLVVEIGGVPVADVLDPTFGTATRAGLAVVPGGATFDDLGITVAS